MGAFGLIRRVLRDGRTFEEARAEAARIGLKNQNLVDFAREYVAAHAPGRLGAGFAGGIWSGCRDSNTRPWQGESTSYVRRSALGCVTTFSGCAWESV